MGDWETAVGGQCTGVLEFASWTLGLAGLFRPLAMWIAGHFFSVAVLALTVLWGWVPGVLWTHGVAWGRHCPCVGLPSPSILVILILWSTFAGQMVLA